MPKLLAPIWVKGEGARQERMAYVAASTWLGSGRTPWRNNV